MKMRERIIKTAACWIPFLLAINSPTYGQGTIPAKGDLSAFILTPPVQATPRINGARIFGVRPENPVLYTIAASGDEPMRFTADPLPAGLAVDSGTGQITGIVATAGSYEMTLHASNGKGADEKKLKLIVGDQIALTPPMGWNTYYAFRLNISDALVRRQAAAMVSSGLIKHGWTYVSIDEGWARRPSAQDPNLNGQPRDADGRILPNKKFPDMKALCRDVHAEGLKIGIYSSPGALCCGGQVGTYQHEDQDAQTFADWGFDYVKYDWCFYAQVAQEIRAREYVKLLPESADQLKSLLATASQLESARPRTANTTSQLQTINEKLDALYAKMDPARKRAIDVQIAEAPYRLFADSMAKTKRDMVFSLCQYGMNDVWDWGAKAGGNLWRTHRDIIDDWTRVTSIGFGEEGTESHAGPGHWNDPDILQVGVENKGVPSRLTPDEQYSHVSLWCLLDAPLLIGGDLTKLDPFTMNLLSNDEVIAVNQDALGRQAARIATVGSGEVWAKEMEDGSQSIGLFNRGNQTRKVVVAWKDLHMSGPQIARDLWRQKDLATFAERFEADVPAHGVVLISARAAGR